MTGINLNKYATGAVKGYTKALLPPRGSETLTIDKITEKVFTEKDGTSRVKPILNWVEDRPPLTLNRTNVKFLIREFGETEEHYAGRKVMVFHDPTVEMGGTPVGGIVLRLPQQQARKEDFNDKIPF